MILYSDVFDDVLEACRGNESERMKAKVERTINNDYQAIAAMVSWADMRKTVELDISSGSAQLPSDLLGIDLVWDDDNEIEFLDRRASDSVKKEYSFRYFTNPVGSVLADVDDAQVMQGSTVLTSSDLSTVHASTPLDGEYCYIDGESQYYEIVEESGGAFTISPAYRGTGQKSSARVVVRPQNTRVIEVEVPYGYLSTTTTLDIYYWAAPPMLRDPRDIVLLPTADVLVMRSLSKLAEAQPHRPVSQQRVDQALREAIALNPGKPMPRMARGLHGRVLPNASMAYASREGFVGNSIRETYQLNRI